MNYSINTRNLRSHLLAVIGSATSIELSEKIRANIHLDFFSGLSQGRGLLQRHFHVICVESLGFQRRRSRVWIVPLSQRRRCFGRALRCSLSVQYMCESCRGLASQSHIGAYAAHQSAFLLSTGRFANEPGLGILCRMPTEDLRAGPKLALSLPIKAPSFQGPAGMMSRSDREILMGLRRSRENSTLNSQISTLSLRRSRYPAQGSRQKAQGPARTALHLSTVPAAKRLLPSVPASISISSPPLHPVPIPITMELLRLIKEVL